jgi:uncharacterized membrane protein
MKARWMTVAALVGLGFSTASTWVHYRILQDPLYSSVCDVNATFSCSEAYTSRFGSFGGISVALIGVLFFTFVLMLIALCQRSASARQNLPGYVFVLSTAGLAGVLYLAYASWFILNTVCLLCVGTYGAVIALFLLSGSGAKYPMTTLPGRASRDLRTMARTPAALAAAVAFLVVAGSAIALFPAGEVAASSGGSDVAGAAAQERPMVQLPPEAIRQLETYLEGQERVQVPGGGGSGAAVVLVKFNDYQCPPCGLTYQEYKPVLARLQKEFGGKIAFITKDFPLDPECNSLGGSHMAACEAAVAVRLARQNNRADTMEDWLFANQPSLTPERVREGAASVGGVKDFDARYAQTLELVRADIAQGLQLGVRGTPTFFMNGIRLPSLRGEYLDAAVRWELRRVAK